VDQILNGEIYTQTSVVILPKVVHGGFVRTSASDWLERLVSDVTYNVLMGPLNPTHSVTPMEAFRLLESLCSFIGAVLFLMPSQ